MKYYIRPRPTGTPSNLEGEIIERDDEYLTENNIDSSDLRSSSPLGECEGTASRIRRSGGSLDTDSEAENKNEAVGCVAQSSPPNHSDG